MLYLLFIVLFVHQIVGPPVDKEKKVEDEFFANTDGLNTEQLQDHEYFRYAKQVFSELENDPQFNDIIANATEEDIRSGKLADSLPLSDHKIRRKLDELKRAEVERQRDLIRQNKDHMAGIERNYWNPIHHNNQESFDKEDLKKLFSKHNDMMNEQDGKRKKEFKNYEMDKEHLRREKMKNMTEEERKQENEKYNQEHHPKHEKMHEPGHKAQMEEVWEKEDGLDPESFDPKTFFNLHDKNADGFLDQFELETIFLADVDKVYNESDPNTDPKERSEEIERMREHVMGSMDKDKDGLISYDEFIAETKEDEFEKDEDWKPLTEEDQYTEDELSDYEKMMEKEDETHHEENTNEHS